MPVLLVAAADVEAALQLRERNLPKKFHPICVVHAIRAKRNLTHVGIAAEFMIGMLVFVVIRRLL